MTQTRQGPELLEIIYSEKYQAVAVGGFATQSVLAGIRVMRGDANDALLDGDNRYTEESEMLLTLHGAETAYRGLWRLRMIGGFERLSRLADSLFAASCQLIEANPQESGEAAEHWLVVQKALADAEQRTLLVIPEMAETQA